MKQWHIFLAFFRSGILGYGGGPSIIPLVHKEVVDRFKWMSDEEFGDVLAIGNTLPGPINTKMAGYIGYRVGGLLGMINAIIATVLPTIIFMIILLTTLVSFKDKQWVQGMTKAIVPVVGVMLATLTWQFFKSSLQGLKWKFTSLHIVGGLILIQQFHVHPGFVIGALLLFALVKPKGKANKKGKEKEMSA
ncbi:MAG: chromate transporter [Ectobacillus sp.]